jgi:hypothetical protein
MGDFYSYLPTHKFPTTQIFAITIESTIYTKTDTFANKEPMHKISVRTGKLSGLN